jgi:uncharacterized protein YbcV (DUF1398 family)
MDTRIIAQAASATLSGGLPFPQIVGMLIEAGVEYYHVDYAGRSKSFYSAEGDRVVTPITFEKLPPIASEFDLPELKAAILDSQRNGQKFYDFSVRAMGAGVQGYYAFLRGQRVTYFGRDGEEHTEWFPGAKPNNR